MQSRSEALLLSTTNLRLSLMNREILRIALPAIIANITVPLLGLMDVGIAGHLGAAKFIGAVSVGAMIFNLVYWNFGFLRMGTSGMTAQAYGRGDFAASAMVLKRACAVALAIGLGIIALQIPLQWLALLAIGPSDQIVPLAQTYFYIGVWGAPALLLMMAIKGWFLGMQDSTSPMIISIGVNVVNIAVSLVAVFVLDMGFAGIAVGTLSAEWIGLAYSLHRLFRLHPELRRHIGGENGVSWKSFAALFRGSGDFFKVNGDIFFRSLLLMVVMLVFLAVGARSGDLILAVNSLMMQLFTLYAHFMDGVAFAGEALAGKYYGARNVVLLRRCVRGLFRWGLAFTVLFTVIYVALPQPIYQVLTDNAEVVAAAMDYRWWCAAIPAVSMAAFVWDGVYIGLTRTRGMLVAVLVSSVTFYALYAALPGAWGNHKLWVAFLAYLAVRGLVQTALYGKILAAIKTRQ